MVMATYKELRKQADELTRRAEEALQLARKESLAQTLLAIAEFGFTAVELGFVELPASAGESPSDISVPKTTRAPKYRDPVSGVTWTGAGHQPKWVIDSKDLYLINKEDGS
jgi:DNA-binding protein H-NS